MPSNVRALEDGSSPSPLTDDDRSDETSLDHATRSAVNFKKSEAIREIQAHQNEPIL